MKMEKSSFFFIVLCLLTFCASTWAISFIEPEQWSEPAPLIEINTDYYDKAPFLSFDGLTLYFSRQDGPGWHYTRIYQATRHEPYGPFTSIEELSALNYSGGHVDYPWISPDNLRMYYYRTEAGSIRRLKFTERASIKNTWQPGVNISELNALGGVANPSLTEDELTMVFTGTSVPGGLGGYDIWMATREERNSPFNNIINLTETNSPAWDLHPSISPDGLTLYFASERNGNSQLFRATRESLDAHFGVPKRLFFLDSSECSLYYPFVSSDGTTFYFAKSVDGEPLDIWVSYTSGIPQIRTYHVNAVNGNDLNNGLNHDTAFATIQKGIDSAKDGDTVLVYPGLYKEEINFQGKAITMQGVAGSNGVPILESIVGFTVSFYHGEGPDSVLKNFIIRNSFMAVFTVGSSPTISNLTVVENKYGIRAYAGSELDISSSIFWNNISGDLFGCQARYSWVQEEIESEPLEGLISHWSFDDGSGTTAYDLTGNNHGTIHGAQWTTGQIGGALSFDGVDDYVELPDNNPIWLPQYDFTLSVWLYFERDFISTPGASEVILDLNYGASAHPANELGYNVQRRGDSGKMCFQMTTTTNSDEDLYSNKVLDTITWHHIVAVRNGTIQAIYVDGRLDESRICSPDPIDFVGGYDDDNVNVGRYTTTIGQPRYYLQGRVDDFRIYNRALSAEEIQQLYESGLNGGGSVTNPLFADPVKGDYHLLSERGRYWPEHNVWVLDNVTSPCIDAGDPAADCSDEPKPNGGRINMGAYSGTAYASMSEWPITGDVNRDGTVDLTDLITLIENWLQSAGWLE